MRFVEERQRYVVNAVLVDGAEMMVRIACHAVPHARHVVVVWRAAARTRIATARQTARHNLDKRSRRVPFLRNELIAQIAS